MRNRSRPELARLATGVPGLDDVLGGGLPEYSLNLVAGDPGAGKTTLVHQILFANATVKRPVLYFTALGESSLKMLRYQQQMNFFDPALVGDAIRFIDLGPEILGGDLDAVFDRIVALVDEAQPGIVVADSFRSLLEVSGRGTGLQHFLQRLALHLATWHVTSFLIGEYTESELSSNPIATIADGVITLSQSRDRNTVVRKLQVLKLRGQASMPGLHTFRITSDGVEVFPRLRWRAAGTDRRQSSQKLSTGSRGLDALMHGGIPAGDSVLIGGPTGTGKTVIATQFIAEGVKQGERGVLVLFEEHPEDFALRALELGLDLPAMIASGMIGVVYLRPLDLSVDETLRLVHRAVADIGATRLVIDSLTGFELAIAPTFRADFRESIYRMVGAMTGIGVTVVMTVEITESLRELAFSPHAISFLTENVILLRHLEIEGQLRKMLTVVKMRRSAHERDLREYEITGEGIAVGERLDRYEGVLTGIPRPRLKPSKARRSELSSMERRVLAILEALGEATEARLVKATEINRRETSAALARLIALSYAVVVTEKRRRVYRPASRAPGR